jgi:hypothetical protein
MSWNQIGKVVMDCPKTALSNCGPSSRRCSRRPTNVYLSTLFWRMILGSMDLLKKLSWSYRRSPQKNVNLLSFRKRRKEGIENPFLKIRRFSVMLGRQSDKPDWLTEEIIMIIFWSSRNSCSSEITIKHRETSSSLAIYQKNRSKKSIRCYLAKCHLIRLKELVTSWAGWMTTSLTTS